jgi:N-dimethylarginine dimethylaminohydrolase
MRAYGAQSMIQPLRRVVVRPPDAVLGSADPAQWHYARQPDLDAARVEHAALVRLLEEDGTEIIVHDVPLDGLADAMFTHDPVLVTDAGTIVLRMGKELRRGEEEALATTLERHGVPIAGRLTEPAIAEGGDLLWLGPDTLAVGLGFRTNAAALDQLRALLPDVELIPVPLPYWRGAAACLHLMSLVSIVDHDLAVVHLPLLPVPFFELLSERGYRLIEVPADEMATHGTNVLATSPGRCIILEGNPHTQIALEEAGCAVRTYRGDEITLICEGGATCLTRPVLRG